MNDKERDKKTERKRRGREEPIESSGLKMMITKRCNQLLIRIHKEAAKQYRINGIKTRNSKR